MQFKILGGSQILIETWILEDDAKLLAHLVLLASRIQSVQLQRTAGGWEERSEHFNRGGFPGPVGPEKCENFTLRNFEGDIVNRGEIAKSLDKVLHANQGTSP